MRKSIDISIEHALEENHSKLTELAFEAKRHWAYPENYMEIWRDELTISRDHILNNLVFTARNGEGIIGFYSITENIEDFYSGEVFVQKGFWLEHIFVKPEFHHWGIGTKLIDHALNLCSEKEIKRLLVFVDPFARGFYEKVGAQFLYDSKSSIPGRKIPVFIFQI